MSRTVSADEDFTIELRKELTQLGSGDTRVQDVLAYRDESLAGLERWHVRLVLPRPVGPTWDALATMTLSRDASDVSDRLAQQHGVLLDEPTAVDVVATDAPDSEIPVTESPEPDEDPSVGEQRERV